MKPSQPSCRLQILDSDRDSKIQPTRSPEISKSPYTGTTGTLVLLVLLVLWLSDTWGPGLFYLSRADCTKNVPHVDLNCHRLRFSCRSSSPRSSASLQSATSVHSESLPFLTDSTFAPRFEQSCAVANTYHPVGRRVSIDAGGELHSFMP